MRFLFVLVLLCTSGIANATNYFFSTTNGDDSRTTAQAQNPATPWKTLAKLNSFFNSLNPGDFVLFQRGDVFPGSITVTKDGTSGNPITFGAYGTGAKPVISGFTTVSAWTNLGSNIYESTSAVTTLSTLNLVVIGDTSRAMGRYPNTGFLTYQSSTGSSITSSSLTGTPNWTGAEVVIRMYRWVIDRCTVTSQSGGTLNFVDNDGDYDPSNNFGFFIQNDARTLDQQNEWYFDPATKKLRVYSSAVPTNVKVPIITTLVTISQKDYITFDNIAFEGANEKGIYNYAGQHFTLNACDINYSGTDAVNTYPNSPYLKIENCQVNNSNNAALYLGASQNITVRYNSINNTGIFQGMGKAVNSSFEGITSSGNDCNISYNSIINTGYCGIKFDGDRTIVSNNFINNFCFSKDDGGGIYNYPSQGPRVYARRTVQNNIVINSPGAAVGTNSSESSGHGIYLDGNASQIDYIGNTIANCSLGLFLHGAQETSISNNTVYDCSRGLFLIKYNTVALSNISNKNNIYFARLTNQYPAYYEPMETTMPASFVSDSNYYVRPINDNKTVWFGVNETNVYYTLAEWKTFTGKEAHSAKSPVAITTVNDLRFEYNETSTAKTISLGTNYIDVKGFLYPGTITLQPYTTAVLIKSGAGNAVPTANAGGDKTIVLPVSSSSLAGSGTDPDGTIASYAWTKVSGPTAGTITAPTSASTTATGLVQGVYKFELKVTDNLGATAKDTMQVTVNAASANLAPVADAGAHAWINLPLNTISLLGTGTDPDGTIASYAWTKVSGPTAGTITTLTSASTTATGLVQGVYKWELTVTDNQGATGKDTVYTVVNMPPTANAGTDQTITLPTATVSLFGTGSDVDGTIASYAWTKVSGPASGTISTPTSASTTVTGLVQGVYIFEFKVTDNSLASVTDSVKVTVNAGANVAPTANAGVDRTITLPTNSVSLTGTGIDTDGTIASYAWTKVSGPTSGTITSATSASTTVTSLVQGTYKFELKVTDNSGATGRDTMQVIVNAANVAPTANAGTDKIISLPTNSVSLTGTGTDTDGTIASYAWTKVSGPTSGTITSATSASTTVTSLVQGTYKFELKVTDNSGAMGRDTMQVTVNAVNIAPTANAGLDQNITLPTSSASLTGSGTDTDGTIASYSWTKISGPTSGTITSATSASTTVTSLVQGTYKFELKVTDNNGATGKDTVQVNVNAAANVAPTANAGTDKIITLPTNSVSLTGTGTDTDGTIASYAWTKVSGPTSGTITSATSASTTVTSLVQGTYKFELKVTDNSGAIGRDTMQVTVNAVNVVPTANAGLDQNITLPTSSASLTGTGTDADGTIASYAWTKVSGPTSGTITSATSASTTVTSLVQGTYKFELKVTDNSGAIGRDTMQVIVNAANVAPTANAGVDKTITLPTNSVSLTGTGTDADGTIASYAWTKVSGPTSGTITSATSASTTVTSLVQGTYKFELKVTDNSGAIGRDTMQVIVNAANVAPTANAGVDKTITLPTNSVSLTGTGTDADGTIASYAWTKVSGPTSGTITSATSASTTVTSLVQGTYKFELKVTDNSGAIGRDTIQVIVNAANVAPTANAGVDQTVTLPTVTASLAGTGTDTDGTIASYAWTKISGPTSGTITSATSASTTVTSLLEGTYKFELKVTDNSGAIARDTMQVTVNPAPAPKIIRVNIYDGTNPYNDSRWNNWKPVVNVASSNFKYEDGTASVVNSALSNQASIVDNGANYVPTATICPPAVLRYTSANTTSRTFNINGLDATKRYSFEFYASSTLTGNQTEFVINGSNYIISTGNNKNGYAEYFNIRPNTSGTVVVTLNTIGTWNYLSAVTIIEQTGLVIVSRGASPEFGSAPAINTDPEVEINTVTAFPLPFTTSFTVSLSGKLRGEYELSLLNISGRPVWRKTINKNSVQVSETVNTGNIQTGVYILEVISPDRKRSVYKFIKE